MPEVNPDVATAPDVNPPVLKPALRSLSCELLPGRTATTEEAEIEASRGRFAPKELVDSICVESVDIDRFLR